MPKTWTDEECSFLKEQYLEMTNEELAEKFNVTATSIRKKLERLSLKRSASSTASQKKKESGQKVEKPKAQAKKSVAKKEKPAKEEAAPVPDKLKDGKAPELKDGFKEYTMKATYKVGDFIFHKVWNDAGEVVDSGTTEDGHKFIQVDFQNAGTKRLVIDYMVG
ncbi:MAG: hypothetical protein QGH40_01155 [bacterium]|jgi:hypothetical protein|nr:hypothetical protein [bacterium]